MDPGCHLNYLDSFGETEELLEQYQNAYRSMAQIKRQMDGLEMDEAEKARKVDTLSYQIQELERAELPGQVRMRRWRNGKSFCATPVR